MALVQEISRAAIKADALSIGQSSFAVVLVIVFTNASAADLKFLHHLQQTLLGTSNRKAALES
jgi:hypothetical protein